MYLSELLAIPAGGDLIRALNDKQCTEHDVDVAMHIIHNIRILAQRYDFSIAACHGAAVGSNPALPILLHQIGPDSSERFDNTTVFTSSDAAAATRDWRSTLVYLDSPSQAVYGPQANRLATYVIAGEVKTVLDAACFAHLLMHDTLSTVGVLYFPMDDDMGNFFTYVACACGYEVQERMVDDHRYRLNIFVPKNGVFNTSKENKE